MALTAAPERRADRALAAAHAHLQAGSFEAALGLLAEAEAAAVDKLQRARVEQLRGQVARASDHGREAPVRLLRAAVRLESLDLRLARDSYLHALFASLVAGRLAQPGGRLREVARAARSVAPPGHAPLPRDLLPDGMATMIIDGRAAAEPTLRRAVHAFLRDEISADDWAQWGLLGTGAAIALWDFDSWAVLSSRCLQFARASGALALLSAALGVGPGGALASVAERRRACGTLLHRSGRAARTHSAATRPRPRPPALRRVAAPRGQKS